MSRTPGPPYVDPLDLVWTATARRFGLMIVRSDEVFASTDGAGTLTLGTPETLDPDDCLAQMVLHELCHWLVQGTNAAGEADWGLDNDSVRDVHREHACLRTQAALLEPLGLRAVLGPTTDFRSYYDALPSRPLDESTEEDPSVPMAREAMRRAGQPEWMPLHEALDATRRMAQIVQRYIPAGTAETLWARLVCAIEEPS